MASTIPGLQQLDDQAGRGQQFQGRPIVSPEAGAQDPRLQPVATPVDTFIHAAQPATNAPELGRIADALSAFQPELAQYSQTQKMVNNQQAQMSVPGLLAHQTPAQIAETLASNPAFKNNVAAMRLGQASYGSALADQTLSQMQQDFSTNFDKKNGDFNQWSNDWIKKSMGDNTDKFFQQTFLERMNSGVQAMRQHWTGLQAGFQKEDQDNLITGATQSIINDGITKGQTPQQVMDNISHYFTTNQAIAGRPPNEQQQLLVGILARQGETLGTSGDYEPRYQMIKQLLQLDRGNGLGSLVSNPEVGPAAVSALTRSEGTYIRRAEVENTGMVGNLLAAAHKGDVSYPALREQFKQQFPESNLGTILQKADAAFQERGQTNLMLQQKQQLKDFSVRETNSYINSTVLPALQSGNAVGSLKDVIMHDAKGQEVTYTVAQQLKDGVETAQSLIDRTYAGKENDPQAMAEKFQTEAHLYAVNGQTNAGWKRQLSAGYASALTAAATGEKQNITPALQQGYQLYKQLDGVSPAALQVHASGPAETLYALASSAEHAGLSESQALAMAAKATQDKDFIKNLPSLSMTEKTQDIKTALSQQAGNSFWPWGSNLSNVDNSSEVAAHVGQFANLLHGAYGIPMDQAITQAAERIGKQYQVINGTAVNVSGKGIPSNFADLTNGFIQNWWQDHGAEEAKEGHSMSDLTIRQLGNNPQWVMLYKSSMVPPSSPHAAFGLSELLGPSGVAAQQQNQQRGNLGKAFDAAKIGQQLRDSSGGATGPM